MKMNEEKAREILGSKGIVINSNDDLEKNEAADDFVCWYPISQSVYLSSNFTPDELEAIAWWMRNKKKSDK